MKKTLIFCVLPQEAERSISCIKYRSYLYVTTTDFFIIFQLRRKLTNRLLDTDISKRRSR
jgi:hypothetical protein